MRTNYGRTLGGYSHYKWMNDDKMIKEGMDRNTVIDERRRTFLLQMDEQHKLVPETDDNLIFCSLYIGPCFGYNLQIGDNCNK